MRAEKLHELKERGLLRPGKTYDDAMMNEVLQASRFSFETVGKRDIDVALEESLDQYEKELVARGVKPEEEVEKLMKASMDTFERVKLSEFVSSN